MSQRGILWNDVTMKIIPDEVLPSLLGFWHVLLTIIGSVSLLQVCLVELDKGGTI